MKTLTIFTLLVGGTWAFVINISKFIDSNPTVHYDWVHMQKVVLPLFENVCEESKNPMIMGLADEFNMDLKNGNFSISPYTTLKEFIAAKSLLPKHEIFSEYNDQHFKEFKFFSELLYNINDFHTFLKVAAWSHRNLNCGLYLNVVYSALLRRRDTKMLSVPAPYEILPNYFITRDAIMTGSTLLTGGVPATSDNIRVVGNTYVVDVNYTADFYNNADESSLAYFHEDVGLNTYFYMRKLQKSIWLNNPLDMDSEYGEYAYHTMKQLDTRYNMERYSNGFKDVLAVNWREPVSTMYDPMLIYSNGNDFGRRTKYIDMTTIPDTAMLQEIENNVYEIAMHMKQSNYNRTQIMNTIIETGTESYEKIAYLNAGKSDDFKDSPSVLEHYMTTMRDPIFWRINKKMVEIIDNTLEQLQPKYDKNELFFPGVEIINVDIKKISTFCDDFDFDATDALKSSDIQSNFLVKFSQPRLDHKPFSMKLNISSLVSQKGLVKIFLGPKMLPGEFASKKDQFMLLDSFEVMLKKGGNAISRSSSEMNYLANDFTTMKSLRKKVQDAEFGLDVLLETKIDKYTDFPSRLLLPKGSEDGIPFQLFVFIAPFVKVTVGSVMVTTTEYNSATLNPRYPLDTYQYDWELFDLPNAFTKEVTITHKPYTSPNAAAGTNAGKKPGSYDYSAKKEQYGKKEDYSMQKHFESDQLKFSDEPQQLQAKSKWEKYITDDEKPKANKNEETNEIETSTLPTVPLEYDDNTMQQFLIDSDISKGNIDDSKHELLEKAKWTKYITTTEIPIDDEQVNIETMQLLQSSPKWFKWPKYMRGIRNVDSDRMYRKFREYSKDDSKTRFNSGERKSENRKREVDKMVNDYLNTNGIPDHSKLLKVKPQESKFVYVIDTKNDKTDNDINTAPLVPLYPDEDSDKGKTKFIYIEDDMKPKLKADIFLTLQLIRKPSVYDYLLPDAYTRGDDEDTKVYV